MANFFTDRSVEYPGRYRLASTDDPNVYDLTRQEGTIYNAGTPLNAENLNNAMQDVIDMIPTDYVDKDDLEGNIDTSQPTGTTDGDLYKAINDNGWSSSVISSGKLLMKELFTKIMDKLLTKTLSPTITTTTGTLVSYSCKRVGNVVYFSISARKTTATAVGGYILEANVSNMALPPGWVTNGTYYGSQPLMAAFSSAGVLRLRHTGTTSITMGSSDSAAVSFTYVVG